MEPKKGYLYVIQCGTFTDWLKIMNFTEKKMAPGKTYNTYRLSGKWKDGNENQW